MIFGVGLMNLGLGATCANWAQSKVGWSWQPHLLKRALDCCAHLLGGWHFLAIGRRVGRPCVVHHKRQMCGGQQRAGPHQKK